MIQKLWQRSHIRAMQTSNPDLPLGRYVLQVHSGIFPAVLIFVLDRIHPSPQGGDFNKLLLQCELRWILNLNATSPPGLNEAFNLKPFLHSFSSGGLDRDL